MGRTHYGEGDFGRALEYYTKAAELGHVEAHCCLASFYYRGNGVEEDVEKAIHHLEKAAIGGHPGARSLLAFEETKNGRFDRAVKHLNISTNLGCNDSLTLTKDLFIQGIVSKDEYTAALRGYQAPVDATKSAAREKGDAFYARR